MANETVKKITKKDRFNLVMELFDYAEANGYSFSNEEVGYEDMRGFIDHEIELIDAKTEAAKKRAEARRIEGDELREKVLSVLSKEDFMVIPEIVTAINDPDVSANMVTNRLSQLKKLDKVEQDFVTVVLGEGNKTKKLSAYRAL